MTSATGSSKLMPKAKNSTTTKSRYFTGSGVILMMSGENEIRNRNAPLSTTK